MPLVNESSRAKQKSTNNEGGRKNFTVVVANSQG